jgi:hypothetical protein
VHPLALAALAVLVVAGVVTGLLGGSGHARGSRPSASQAQAQRLATQAQRQQPARSPMQMYQSAVATGERQRKTLERELEAAIARDGRSLVSRHYLRGPVIGSTCTLMGSIESTAEGVIGHYNCMAIRRRIENLFKGVPPTLEGARFFATINLTAGSYTYRGD